MSNSPGKLYGWKDYNSYFDPRKYLDKYHTETNFSDDNVHRFTSETFYHIFYDVLKKKLNPNARLLEIGSGCSLLLSLFTSNIFDEIYLSDYSERNRITLTKALNGTEDSFDWQSRIDCMRQHNIQIDENALQQLRIKVKDVAECNVKNAKVLSKPIGPVDCVACLLCLEAASDTLAQYKEASKNVINLLKPSGYYVQAGVLDQPYYDAGSAFFRSLSTTKKQVMDTLDANGVDIQEWFEYYDGGQGGPWGDGSPSTVGFYICYGIKRAK